MDHRLRKSVSTLKKCIGKDDIQWKTCVGQATMALEVTVCGRGSAIVCVMNARIAATEKVEKCII